MFLPQCKKALALCELKMQILKSVLHCVRDFENRHLKDGCMYAELKTEDQSFLRETTWY